MRGVLIGSVVVVCFSVVGCSGTNDEKTGLETPTGGDAGRVAVVGGSMGDISTANAGDGGSETAGTDAMLNGPGTGTSGGSAGTQVGNGGQGGAGGEAGDPSTAAGTNDGDSTQTAATGDPGQSGKTVSPGVVDPKVDNPCRHVTACYNTLQRELCGSERGDCQAALQAPNVGDDTTACKEELRRAPQTARPYMLYKANYKMPADCG